MEIFEGAREDWYKTKRNNDWGRAESREKRAVRQEKEDFAQNLGIFGGFVQGGALRLFEDCGAGGGGSELIGFEWG